MAETPDLERRPRLDVVAHLQSSAVFGDLDRNVLERLASCLTETTLRAGEALMVEGDEAGDAFIVIAGRLVVSTSTDGEGERTIAQLAPGSVVGEMGLYRGSEATADVVVDELAPGAATDVTETFAEPRTDSPTDCERPTIQVVALP